MSEILRTYLLLQVIFNAIFVALWALSAVKIP